MNRQAVGIPLLFSLDASLSCAQIYDKTLTSVISYAKDSSGCVMSKKALRKNLRLRISTQDGPPTDFFISPDDNQSFVSFLEANRIEFSQFFDLEWVDLIDFGRDGTRIHYSNFTSMTCDPSYTEREHKLRSDPNSVSLYECFESFTQPGKLECRYTYTERMNVFHNSHTILLFIPLLQNASTTTTCCIVQGVRNMDVR